MHELTTHHPGTTSTTVVGPVPTLIAEFDACGFV